MAGAQTMIPNLTFPQLLSLLTTVFSLRKEEKECTILVDLPNRALPDNPAWKDRREIAREWYAHLADNRAQTPFSRINLCCYENVGSNNNDLPESVTLLTGEIQAISAEAGEQRPLRPILESSSVVLAPTELSATAPLKVLGKALRFRGATLPGFSRQMLPTLALNYEEVNERVLQFKRRMDDAEAMDIRLSTGEKTHHLAVDLRYRTGHASGGLMREPGVVGNLPSGEAYIVPYEGERAGEASKTEGNLPVQFNDEIVLYRIERNRAIEVASKGKFSDLERGKLAEEPAYGNIAEIGIGVLGEWGVQAVGSTLVDEKLGLHIAFGRSEHFGGVTSPSSFRNPSNVIHIDRVYVPSVQPKILVGEVTFVYPDNRQEQVISNGKYLV